MKCPLKGGMCTKDCAWLLRMYGEKFVCAITVIATQRRNNVDIVNTDKTNN